MKIIMSYMYKMRVFKDVNLVGGVYSREWL
jgi:hypothetical protein